MWKPTLIPRLALAGALLLSLALLPKADVLRAGSASGTPTGSILSGSPLGAPALALTPGLSLAKGVAPHENIARGGTVTFTITLANNGPSEAANVLITDTLPVSTTFAYWAAQPSGATMDADRLTWSGTVSAGEAITLSFAVTHTGGYGEVVTNTVVGQHISQTAAAQAAFSVAQVYTLYLPVVIHGALDLPGFSYGIQIHGEHRLPESTRSVQDLGMTWVKQQVRWAQIEGTPGTYGWAGLDHIVDTYNAAGLKVLLSVTAAPDWSRPGKPRDGPPNDYQLYYDFMGLMAARFKGRVHAYEIWNEPNLQREWNEGLISAWNYKRLLRGAYQAIKAADPEAVVVSAGLNPVGYTDNVTAVDDREYLQRLYTAGFKPYCDAVGVHPYGFANPPDVYYEGGDLDPNRGWDDHPSFFFRNTMEDYYAIMLANGDGGKRLWATEFGWPTVDGMYVLPNSGLEYQADITEGQQAEYIVRALEWSRDWGHAGVMILWNLNYWSAAGPYSEMAKYGLLRADWSARPAYVALRELPK